MNVNRCINGHYYDADKYQVCPHCGSAPEGSVQSSRQSVNTPQSQFIKQTGNTVSEAKQVSGKTVGKTFGAFEESVKAPVKPVGKTFGAFEESAVTNAAEGMTVASSIVFPEQTAPKIEAEKPFAVRAESAVADESATAANGQIRCAECGKLINSTAKFCKYCGARVTEKHAAGGVFESVKAAAGQFSSKVSETVKPAAEHFAAKITDVIKPSDQAAAVPTAISPEITEKAAENRSAFVEIPPQDPVKEAAETAQGSATDIEAMPAAEKTAEVPAAEPEKVSLQQAVRNAVSGSEGKTVGYFSMGQEEEAERDVEPVVGWLVCTKGKHLGESFCIYAGRNSVGRGVSNRIVLSRDNTVSREKHVWITYDPKHRVFYIQPGEGSGLAYLNSETVMSTKEMKARDQIEIGNGMYLLIPLCGEDFSWEEYI